MKIIVASLLLVFSFNGFSQSSAKFYFDKAMHPVPKKNAEIYGIGEMDSGLYKLTCYYLKRKNPLACVVHFTDSTQSTHEGWFQYYFDNGATGTKGNYYNGKKEGLWIDYDEKGAINDSVEYKNGMALMRKGFYNLPLNHQKLVTVDDVAHNKFYTTLSDSTGNVLSSEEIPEDYTDVYFNNDTLCSFPGGPAAWQRYISKALTSHISEFSETDYGTVLLRFVINSDGNITDVRPLTMKASTLAMVASNAADSSPKWIPAQYDGKKVRTIKIQPITLFDPK
jgi:hypothetical protein